MQKKKQLSIILNSKRRLKDGETEREITREREREG